MAIVGAGVEQELVISIINKFYLLCERIEGAQARNYGNGNESLEVGFLLDQIDYSNNNAYADVRFRATCVRRVEGCTALATGICTRDGGEYEDGRNDTDAYVNQYENGEYRDTPLYELARWFGVLQYRWFGPPAQSFASTLTVVEDHLQDGKDFL